MQRKPEVLQSPLNSVWSGKRCKSIPLPQSTRQRPCKINNMYCLLMKPTKKKSYYIIQEKLTWSHQGPLRLKNPSSVRSPLKNSTIHKFKSSKQLDTTYCYALHIILCSLNKNISSICNQNLSVNMARHVYIDAHSSRWCFGRYRGPL